MYSVAAVFQRCCFLGVMDAAALMSALCWRRRTSIKTSVPLSSAMMSISPRRVRKFLVMIFSPCVVRNFAATRSPWLPRNKCGAKFFNMRNSNDRKIIFCCNAYW